MQDQTHQEEWGTQDFTVLKLKTNKFVNLEFYAKKKFTSKNEGKIKTFSDKQQ
jgi:hypothetical protein